MVRKSIAMLAILTGISVMSVQAGAVVLKNWVFKNAKDTRVVKNWYPGRKIKFEKSFAANENVNGISGALAVKIISKQDKTGTGSLQLGFVCKKQLETDGKYKISFYAKSSKEGKISAAAIMSQRPWASLGKTAKLRAEVTSEWKKYEFEFSSMYDYDEAARVPCIFIGDLPVGSVFMVQDIKFEKID
jgi:hypothetical protein